MKINRQGVSETITRFCLFTRFWQCLLRNNFAPPPPDQIQKPTQKVAAFDRNHWQHFIGISGRVCVGLSTLDKESLAIVFDTLKTLRKENRIVGVISHVEEMQQEIDVHLRIEYDENRGSLIKKSWME